MNPQTALDKQIERYRQMTGQERLAIALGLHELACDVARAGIRAQFPEATEEDINLRLKQRIALAYKIEHQRLGEHT